MAGSSLKVYIAGPYTIGDVAKNVRNAMIAGMTVLDHGHYPFVPHLSHFLHLHSPRPYEVWTAMDDAFVESCDALIRIGAESKGADAEVLLARRLGIPVFCGVAEFLEFP
jgi:hypothetical protein